MSSRKTKKKNEKTKRPREHKKTIDSLERQRKTGWAKYFEIRNDQWKTLSLIKTFQTSKIELPAHILNEYHRMVLKYDEDKKECPICLEPMFFEDSILTSCGHLFHKECLSPLEICPICRGKYDQNKKSTDTVTATK